MKRVLILAGLLIMATLSAAAQNSAVGFQLGVGQMTENGIEFDDFDDDVKELYISFELDPGATVFKLKGGQIDTDNDILVGAPGVAKEGNVEYVAAVIEYRFYEVFGSSALFAGVGGYRQEFGTLKENDLGVTAGINALFPVTRRLGVLGEVGYHWINFDDQREILTGTLGLRFAF